MADTAVPGLPDAIYKTATVNGNTYRYIYASPKNSKPVDTVLLVHGFPDLAIGWRHQIPKLVSLGLRVIVPDQLGYGGTDAPDALEKYSFKSVSDDLSALVRLEVGSSTAQILLGGHDWGGLVAWRLAEWYPELVKAIFTVCTPYVAPAETFFDIDAIVKSGVAPSFGYQIQFCSGEVEKAAHDRDGIRSFLAILFGAQKPGGGLLFSPATGVDLENLRLATESPLVAATELDYHADQQARNGLKGALNWYRTRRINFDDERALPRDRVFKIPALFIQARNDVAIRPEMSRGMDKHFSNLTRAETEAGHWALLQASGEVNDCIEKWLKSQGLVLEKASARI
ncbi:Lipid-phosphate phosphatase [Ceratocystis platani]|uniref:Lipid-phosphate phosphatase n=1 Tax=Ceratocystis fimbriata f. sp. platani TaxID=88771 RepID=A0A0F8BL45_CERFI|nr:Lipid-phosphate phosphatase [Ceratocystis platani]